MSHEERGKVTEEVRRCLAIEDAYALYYEFKAPSPTHVCGTCENVSAENVFVCLESGSVHTCDDDCDMGVETREALVCPISGYAKAPELSEASHWLQGQNNTGKTACVTDVAKVDAALKREAKAQEKFDVICQNLRSTALSVFMNILFSDTRKKVNAYRNTQMELRYTALSRKHVLQMKKGPVNIHETMQNFTNVMGLLADSVTGYNSHVKESYQNHREMLAELVERAARTWRIVSEFNEQSHKKERSYSHTVHAMVVLFCSATGVPQRASGDTVEWVLPPIEGLAQLVPSKSDIPQFGADLKPLSRGQPLFKRALLEYDAQNPGQLQQLLSKPAIAFPMVALGNRNVNL